MGAKVEVGVIIGCSDRRTSHVWGVRRVLEQVMAGVAVYDIVEEIQPGLKQTWHSGPKFLFSGRGSKNASQNLRSEANKKSETPDLTRRGNFRVPAHSLILRVLIVATSPLRAMLHQNTSRTRPR